jgi:uncharacterized protein YkwD
MSRWRQAAQRVVVLGVLAALSAAVSTSADRGRPEWTEPEALSRGSVLAAMNGYRERKDLAPLRRDARLDAAAADRIRDMFAQGYFDHVAPDGTQPFVWVRHRGYTYAALGENLATGQRAARQVVDQWMRSKGHRANILGDFEDVGIAIAEGSPTGRYHGYTFVAVYGREGLRARR